jgi:hypothetical protein
MLKLIGLVSSLFLMCLVQSLSYADESTDVIKSREYPLSRWPAEWEKRFYVVCQKPDGVNAVEFSRLKTKLEVAFRQGGLPCFAKSSEEMQTILEEYFRARAARADASQAKDDRICRLLLNLSVVRREDRSLLYSVKIIDQAAVYLPHPSGEFAYLNNWLEDARKSTVNPKDLYPASMIIVTVYETDGEVGIASSWDEVIDATILQAQQFTNDWFRANSEKVNRMRK